MTWPGIVIGLAAFIIIGVFHPLVIKGEYYFGKKIWPAFLGLGLVFAGLSLWTENIIISALFGVIAFASFWSIREIFEQAERVKKGWFPANPRRQAKRPKDQS